MLSRLLAHSSVYLIGSLLATAAGIISFPLFTRIFSVSEYGLMSLVSSLLLFLVGVGKLGMQHSIVRFYGEVRAGQRDATQRQFFSTVLIGLSCSGLAAAATWALVSQYIPWADPRLYAVTLMSSLLIFVRTTDSALANILRAQERSVAYNVYTVAKRYSTLAVVIAVLLLFVPGVIAFYLATLAAEACAVIALVVFMNRECRFAPKEFSPPLLRSMLAFGLPMVAYELGGIAVTIGDRFIIEHVADSESLGLYSAAYNLCEYVQVMLVTSIGQAIVPMYMRLWSEKGEEATRAFVQRSLHYYVMAGAAVVAGITVVREEVLVLAASENYRAGAVVMPLLMAGMIIAGSGTMIAAGIFIHKQTRSLVAVVVGGAALSITLNLILIPRLGIFGAGLSSLLTVIAVTTLSYRISSRYLRIAVPWGAMLKFTALAAIMGVIVEAIEFPWVAATLAARVGAGVLLYAALVLAFDREARTTAAELARRLGRRFRG
jgi:O-antigen/teichoic acid export membrane protein